MWTLWIMHGSRAPVAPTVLRIGIALSSLCMCFRMLRQMIRSHESLVTGWTGKPLLSGVSSQVSLELVRPCKPLPAEQPVADKRSFSSMPSKVSFQVRSFTINLAAAGDVAIMKILLPKIGSGRS